MSIRDVGNVSGQGKKIYGEQYEKFRYQKLLSKPIDEKKIEFFLIKSLIYKKDEEIQKVGWKMYHELSPKDQKAFKAEIRAEEKARKTK